MYLRQHGKAGVLGLAGYLVFAVGYLTIFPVELIAATVLPKRRRARCTHPLEARRDPCP